MTMNRKFKMLAAASVLLLLGGCAGLPMTRPTLDNAPVCEVGRVRAYVVSMFGWLGAAFKLTDESAQAMCPKTTGTPAPKAAQNAG